MLATLKAGAVYVPVDIASPAARVEKIVTAAAPRAMLASADASRLLAGMTIDARVISVDGVIEGATPVPIDAPGQDSTATAGDNGVPAMRPTFSSPQAPPARRRAS